jgi:AICAR transformylase/IMP cyclohydrolase PurH
MPRALISVSDKRGIVEFARGLVELGWEIVSTGGTAASLRKAGLPVTTVEAVTHFPEMMDGRVKTLHPAIHAGLLARPRLGYRRGSRPRYSAFELVAVNLYPFRATIAHPSATGRRDREHRRAALILRAAAKLRNVIRSIHDTTPVPSCERRGQRRVPPGAGCHAFGQCRVRHHRAGYSRRRRACRSDQSLGGAQA